jgi:hypothetical protein
MPLADSDLGNVGVQRGVIRYAKIARAGDPPGTATWVAVLTCGHEAKLAGEPPGGDVRAGPGRYRDCPECTRLERAEGA